MDLVQCQRGFVAFVDGRRVRVVPGDLYSAADPIAVAHRASFGPPDVKSSVPKVAPPRLAATTETGPAEPGSRRQLGRTSRSASSSKTKDDTDQPKGGDSDA